MKVSATLTLSLMLLFIASQTSAAPEKVYKWTDAKGQTHYGQRPPAGTQTEVIKPQTGHSEPVNYEKAPATNDKDDAAKKAAAKDNPLKDKERCEIARKNLDTLKTYARIKIKGDDGEYRYLTPDEQKQKLDEANKAIEESCE